MPIPFAPSSLVASPVGFQHVNLTWADNASDETSQELQRCEGVGCTSFVTVATLSPNVTSYSDPAILRPDEAYRYRIRAVNGSGPSDWSNIASVITNPSYAPVSAGPGNYYHVSSGEGVLGGGFFPGVCAAVAWIRIESAGYATICTGIANFTRVFAGTPTPANPNEYNFGSPEQSYVWFGVVNGKLTVEIQDGRTLATQISSYYVGGFGEAGRIARDAAVASFRSTYAGLAGGEGLTVDLHLQTTFDFFGNPAYSAQLPNGINQGGEFLPPIDLYQKVTLTGPDVPLREFVRVGFRWVTEGASSRLDLWMDCVEVATAPVAFQFPSPSFYLFWNENCGNTLDTFVGGDPSSDTHRGGAAITPITITDYKQWAAILSDAQMANECGCNAGSTPNWTWWPLRSATDTTQRAVGFPALPVGTLTTDSLEPFNPCNVGASPDPPPPPPPPSTGTVIVRKQITPVDATGSFQITALLPPPTPVVFALGPGDSRTFNDVLAGSGYSVIETVPTGYTATYTVSNGSPHGSLVVGENEVVTVVIQNTVVTPMLPPMVTFVAVDCATATITSSGANFTDNTTVAVTQNGLAVVGFSIIFRNATTIVLRLPARATGTSRFCITVSDGTTPSTICVQSVCAGCAAVIDEPTLQVLTTNHPQDDLIVTSEGETIMVLAP